MTNYKNTWRDSKQAFQQQLNRNIYEIKNKYPPHWIHFLDHVKQINPTKIIDVGCGVGTLYALLQIHHPNIQYEGYDYAPQAIELAQKTWEADCFTVCDYRNIPIENIDSKTMVIENALADILPDGDNCVNFLLGLNTQYVGLYRVKTTIQKSYANTYNAYDIVTYEYYHNIDNLISMFLKNNYHYQSIEYQPNILDILAIKN